MGTGLRAALTALALAALVGGCGGAAEEGGAADTVARDAAAGSDGTAPDVPGGRPDALGPADAGTRDIGVDGGGALDAGPDAVAAECAVGAPDRCAPDGGAVERCDHGTWRPLTTCPAGAICLGDPPACVTAADCTPGAVSGCRDDEHELVCHESGQAVLPQPCPEGELCFEGSCRVARCVPGSGLCLGPAEVSRCLPDGQGYGPRETCPVGAACIDGACWSECEADPKFQSSYVGCLFWSTDLGQWYVQEGQMNLDPDASHIPHAVIIGNPGERDAAVRFEVGDGTPVPVADPIVPPGETRAFLMPELSLQQSGVTKKSIRVTASAPVTAAQFNPPNNADFVHTSDASLLLPAAVLGQRYIVVSGGPSIRGLNMGIQMPSVFGYFTVVAIQPGETRVTFTPTAPTEPGPDFPALPAGQPHTVALQQFDVLHVQAAATDIMQTETNDLTGTILQATQPVAVWGGHDCMVVGGGNCDHLETQLAPVATWGDHYVAARLATPAPNVYRVVSGVAGNVITTQPPIGGLSGVTLGEGEWVEVAAGDSFEVSGTGPLQVVQYIAGNDEGGSYLVDASMAALVPTRQYRDDYPILVPSDYAVNEVAIVRPAGAGVYVDGVPLPAGTFRSVGGGAWEVGISAVSEGVVRITGDAPFGLTAYGYDSKVSYAYPAGCDMSAAP